MQCRDLNLSTKVYLMFFFHRVSQAEVCLRTLCAAGVGPGWPAFCHMSVFSQWTQSFPGLLCFCQLCTPKQSSFPHSLALHLFHTNYWYWGMILAHFLKLFWGGILLSIGQESWWFRQEVRATVGDRHVAELELLPLHMLDAQIPAPSTPWLADFCSHFSQNIYWQTLQCE